MRKARRRCNTFDPGPAHITRRWLVPCLDAHNLTQPRSIVNRGKRIDHHH